MTFALCVRLRSDSVNEALLAFLSVTHAQIYKNIHKYTLADIRLPCTLPARQLL